MFALTAWEITRNHIVLIDMHKHTTQDRISPLKRFKETIYKKRPERQYILGMTENRAIT